VLKPVLGSNRLKPGLPLLPKLREPNVSVFLISIKEKCNGTSNTSTSVLLVATFKVQRNILRLAFAAGDHAPGTSPK